jgi:hypothetical protein
MSNNPSCFVEDAVRFQKSALGLSSAGAMSFNGGVANCKPVPGRRQSACSSHWAGERNITPWVRKFQV